MGILDKLFGRPGTPSIPDPELRPIVQQELRRFVDRELFAAYEKKRLAGATEEEALQRLSLEWGCCFDRKVRDASIEVIALKVFSAVAGAHLGAEPEASLERIRKLVGAGYTEEAFLKLLRDEHGLVLEIRR